MCLQMLNTSDVMVGDCYTTLDHQTAWSFSAKWQMGHAGLPEAVNLLPSSEKAWEPQTHTQTWGRGHSSSAADSCEATLETANEVKVLNLFTVIDNLLGDILPQLLDW